MKAPSFFPTIATVSPGRIGSQAASHGKTNAVDCRTAKRLERRTMPTGNPADRLDSWKEIAAYLRRDVRTVQRWEKKEGLPVYRHLHDKLGSIYAYRNELAEWFTTRQQSGAPVASGNRDGAPAAKTKLAVLPFGDLRCAK